jgi:hypothetical protein
MSSLEQRQKALPTVINEDFEACIVARQQMTQACSWQRDFFCDIDTDGKLKSCWGGHLLRALGAYQNGPSDGYAWQQMDRANEIACKLGFAGGACALHQLYRFNDTHSHAEVIAEFDRRLQCWGDQ